MPEASAWKTRRAGGVGAVLAMAAALGYWVANALALGPQLVYASGARAFLGNVSIAVTFVTSVSAAVMAFGWVMARGFVLGRESVSGVTLRTVLAPAGLAAVVVLVGGSLSAAVMSRWVGSSWPALFGVLAVDFLPVGAGSALMGSLVGNLAGSVTLEARDLGRWARINLVLLFSLCAFWAFLLWAVWQLLNRKIGVGTL